MKLTKAKYDILAKMHQVEIDSAFNDTAAGHIYQSNSRNMHTLESDGLVQEEQCILNGAIPVRVEGWVLTHAGRIAVGEYEESLTCQ